VTTSLNDLAIAEGVPQIAALVMGTEDEVKDYMTATAPQFPIQVIDTLKFMSLLEANAPPDFYLIRDGAVVKHMEAEEPGYDELLAFATSKDAPPAEAQK
jgi:citrate lyase beta subunit